MDQATADVLGDSDGIGRGAKVEGNGLDGSSRDGNGRDEAPGDVLDMVATGSKGGALAQTPGTGPAAIATSRGRGADARSRPELPGPDVHPVRRTLRYWFARLASWIVVRAYLRIEFEGRELLPPGPAVLCFNHMNWADPFVLMGILPFRPRLYFFGPKEEDMRAGARNRIMAWVGTMVPYRPVKNDLLEATRRVQRVFDAGGCLGIAGEGRIHSGERELLPLSEGAAYFALRGRVPLIPLAINGTSWLGLGRRVRVRVGHPVVAPPGMSTRDAVDTMTEQAALSLAALVSDAPDQPTPGRFGRWLTEVFNEWPEGARPAPREGRVEPIAILDLGRHPGQPL